ncbi:ATP-dependent DNA helicase [Trichonephila clavipes]|nr:ATP-dependent DNA helicase [Trichonephila clavipes]
MLTSCFPSSPTELWGRYRSHMAEDILRRVRLENGNMAMEFTEGFYNETLINIEDKCLTIANKVLIQLGMPAHTRAEIGSFDVDLRREQSYNISDFQLNHNWLSERAVLVAKNKDVYQLNHFIQSSIQSEEIIYKSIDTVVEADDVVNYPSEFFNSLDLPGMPPHILKLKIGVPVIMLRNVNQPKLCKLMNIVVEATILTGPFKGDVLIPRIPMIPTDTPF